MRFELEPDHSDVSDEQLLEELRRVAQLLNRSSVTRDEFNGNPAFHSATLFRRFGSWAKAHEVAGLGQSWNVNVTTEQLFENLVRVWLKLGRQPRCEEVSRKNSSFCAATYQRRFGGWRKALAAFVSWANEGLARDVNDETAPRGKRRRTPRNINWRLRALVLMRDGARCRLCGPDSRNAMLHVDHIVPWSKNGETVLENLQILCDKCNIGKANCLPPSEVEGACA